MPKLNLTKQQAACVYEAMCVLDNINALIKACIPLGGDGNQINVFETEDGEIAVRVVKAYALTDGETYISQHAFAAIYGIK
jgi:hypothetical protein